MGHGEVGGRVEHLLLTEEGPRRVAGDAVQVPPVLKDRAPRGPGVGLRQRPQGEAAILNGHP